MQECWYLAAILEFTYIYRKFQYIYWITRKVYEKCILSGTHQRISAGIDELYSQKCLVKNFSVWGVFERDLHIVALWQYYVCYTRSGATRCILFMVLFLRLMCRCGFHAALWSHIGSLMRRLAAEPRIIAGLLFSCQYLCGTILVTPCSMVWDWRVSRAGPIPLYWPSWSLTFCLLLFSLSLLSFYWLVLWGWGLRTDRVLIALF